MALEFKINLVEDQAQQPSQPTSAQPSPQQPPHSAAQQPAVPIPQLANIQQTLLPAIAAAAPEISRRLYADATEQATPREALAPQSLDELMRQFPWLASATAPTPIERAKPIAAPETTSPAEGMVRFYHGGNIEPGEEARSRTLTQNLYEAIEEALRAPGGRVHFVDVPETHPQMGEIGPLLADPELAKQLRPYEDANTAQKFGAAAGEAFAGKIQPIVEQMKLAAEDEFEIIPARDENEFELQNEMPWEKTARAEFAKRQKAMADYAREGIVDVEPIPEAIDATADNAEKAAKQRLENIRRQVATDEAYAKLTGNEPPVYDAIDPNAEARQKHLAQMNEYLDSGSRIAAQAGLGATGQILGGAGDVVSGIEGANPFKIASGALQIMTGSAHGTAEAFDAVTDVMRGYTDYVGDLVQNNYIGAFENRLDEAQNVLGKIPIVGEAVASAFGMIVQPVKSIFDLTEDFLSRGGQLGQYSPDLAVANAMSEVRTIFADLDEANVLGPELARMTDNFSEFMTEMRTVFLPFKEWLVTFLADFWEYLKEKLEDANAAWEIVKIYLEDIKDAVLAPIPGSGVGIRETVAKIQTDAAKIRQLWEDRHNKEQKDDYSREFYNLLLGLNLGDGPAVSNPAQEAAGQQAGLRPPLSPASGF